MDFEQAYRKTLIKWQRLAAGEWANPAEDCGLCTWTMARIWTTTRRAAERRVCSICPVWAHYNNTSCGQFVNPATDHFRKLDRPGLKHQAQLVVEELLSIKDSLSKWVNVLEQS